MDRVAVDVLGPLPRTSRGNRYVLVAIDYFTKWMEAYPLPDQEATTVAEALVQGMFSRFGTPSELHSDQGRNFESHVFTANLASGRPEPPHFTLKVTGWWSSSCGP